MRHGVIAQNQALRAITTKKNKQTDRREELSDDESWRISITNTDSFDNGNALARIIVSIFQHWGPDNVIIHSKQEVHWVRRRKKRDNGTVTRRGHTELATLLCPPCFLFWDRHFFRDSCFVKIQETVRGGVFESNGPHLILPRPPSVFVFFLFMYFFLPQIESNRDWSGRSAGWTGRRLLRLSRRLSVSLSARPHRFSAKASTKKLHLRDSGDNWPVNKTPFSLEPLSLSLSLGSWCSFFVVSEMLCVGGCTWNGWLSVLDRCRSIARWPPWAAAHPFTAERKRRERANPRTTVEFVFVSCVFFSFRPILLLCGRTRRDQESEGHIFAPPLANEPEKKRPNQPRWPPNV